jgi:ribose transport system permease protein
MATTQARAAIQAPPLVERFRRAARNQPRVVGVYAILLALLIPASILSPAFRSPTTLFNIVTQSTFTAITTAGQFLVILTGGLDLSVGSVAKLSSVLSASVMDGKDANLFFAALTATAIGLAVGLVNSLVVVRLKVAPFIATFATYYIVRGIAYSYTTRPVGATSPAFFSIYELYFLGLPLLVWAAIGVWAAIWYALNRSVGGRHVFALGGNEEVARRAGIKTDRIKMTVYIVSALLASYAGFLDLTRLGVGDPNVGEGLELDTITAVVVGGTSLFGGRGSVVGVVGGILLLSTITSVFDVLQVESLYQLLLKGLIIVVAVAIYRTRGTRDA